MHDRRRAAPEMQQVRVQSRIATLVVQQQFFGL
jgi:hypothetical protein